MRILMTEQEQLRSLFIEIYPQLTISDFPKIEQETSARDWMMSWLSDYEASDQVIASSEFSNFSWLLEKGFKRLYPLQDSNYQVSMIIQKIFDYISQFEDHSESELIDAEELEYDISLYDDDELDFETQYEIALENIVDDVLQNAFDIIVIDHGDNAYFILAKGKNNLFSKLAKILQSTYSDSHVSLYLQSDRTNYIFENLLENL